MPLPSGAIVLHIHDGVQFGNIFCSSTEKNCAGGSGSQCEQDSVPAISRVCELSFDLSEITEWVDSEGACASPDDLAVQ